MSGASTNTLARLQRWYKSNCDGDWEHSYGVTIGNLDNPGWSVEINLDDTPLAKVHFQRVIHGEDDDNFNDDGKRLGPWWTCKVEAKFGTEDGPTPIPLGRFWSAVCGPDSLDHVLTIFLDWAEANTPSVRHSMPSCLLPRCLPDARSPVPGAS